MSGFGGGDMGGGGFMGTQEGTKSEKKVTHFPTPSGLDDFPPPLPSFLCSPIVINLP